MRFRKKQVLFKDERWDSLKFVQQMIKAQVSLLASLRRIEASAEVIAIADKELLTLQQKEREMYYSPKVRDVLSLDE
jgi:hypothetical protein